MYKSILFYKHSIPRTYFGHSSGHPQRGTLQRMDIPRYILMYPNIYVKLLVSLPYLIAQCMLTDYFKKI